MLLEFRTKKKRTKQSNPRIIAHFLKGENNNERQKKKTLKTKLKMFFMDSNKHP